MPTMQFPKVAAAQRLQTLLLLTTLVAIVLTALLFSDLISSFRTTVISDAEKSLENAVKELIQAQSCVLHHERQCERVQVADSIVLRQARLRTHSHRGRYALSALNGAKGRAAAEMARDNSRVLSTQKLRCAS